MDIRPLADFGVVIREHEYYHSHVAGVSIELVKGDGWVRIALSSSEGVNREGLEAVIRLIIERLRPVMMSADVLYEGDYILYRMHLSGFSGELDFLENRKVYGIVIEAGGVTGDISIGDLERAYASGVILSEL